MAPRLAALALVVLLAGCVRDAPDGRGPAVVDQGGAVTVPGHPGLDVAVGANVTGDGVRLDFRVRNTSQRTYGIEDNCAAHWYGFAVLDASGRNVYPANEAVCALYSIPGPFAPGEARTATRTWSYEIDDGQGGYRDAPSGTYTVRAIVMFHEAPGEGQQVLRGQRDIEAVVP